MSLDVSTQRTIDLFSPHGGSVLISDVVIGETRRQVKSDYVQKLADSIKQIGLINPITIAPDNRLIAGYHRLQAFIQLGETRIPAVILNLSELKARLAEIDENLIRNDLSVLERGEQLEERKAIYEELFPETIARNLPGHINNHSSSEIISFEPTFTEDTADKTGQSRRTIEQEIQILNLPIQPGSGDDYYVTMEDVRLAMENCLQDHMLNHVVSIYDDVFIIEPAPEE